MGSTCMSGDASTEGLDGERLSVGPPVNPVASLRVSDEELRFALPAGAAPHPIAHPLVAPTRHCRPPLPGSWIHGLTSMTPPPQTAFFS